jgi:hypothetical protein
MTHFGEHILRAYNDLAPGEHLVVYKSDVAEAYRLIPMHPIWQMKQINTVDGKRYVDRNNVFGGRRSGDIFIAVMATVMWIMENVWKVQKPNSFVDDVFGVEKSSHWQKYGPYQKVFPTSQTQTLNCWDRLGIPHKLEKQLFGRKLTIIGILVDVENLTLTLPPNKKTELLAQLDRFIVRKDSKERKRLPLKDFERLTGWLSWSCNVFPLIHPCLSSIYEKVKPMLQSHALVHVNRAISKELEWAEGYIMKLSGVVLLKHQNWRVGEADFTIFCDASKTGLGFWYPHLNEGFMAEPPPLVNHNIHFLEGLCMAAALANVAKRGAGSKVVIYTDNEASYFSFNSLHSHPNYNSILLFAAGIQMDFEIRARFLWAEGKSNHVADALSRHRSDLAKSLSPGLSILPFTPPYDAWATTTRS